MKRDGKTSRPERPAGAGSISNSPSIDLHMLPAVNSIDGALIRKLTGDDRIPVDTKIVVQAFRSVVGGRTFHVGFCLGNSSGVSAIGAAVISRLAIEAPSSVLHVAPVVHQDIAWDIVLRHLRTFAHSALLFTFPDSDTYDAGKAPMYYSADVQLFTADGNRVPRLTAAHRRQAQEMKAKILDRPPPSPFYATSVVPQEDAPWIFRFVTPVGKEIRTAVWDGRRNYAHELPADILRWVGGDKIAIVQVDSPVGINLRSSLNLTHHFARDFDGIIHWARNTEIFQSILKSFIRLELDSVGPPKLPDNWKAEITIFPANGNDE